MAAAAIWESAERAVTSGDAATLQRLLRENEVLFRDQHPPPYGPGGLAPDYSGGDAQVILLREHKFETWPQFAEYLDQRSRPDSPVAQFEAAADAIVSGGISSLRRLLTENPDLIHARSTRTHHATLLHYCGGNNGGESYRQKCPPNIVEIAQLLLAAGADVNAPVGGDGGSTPLGSIATDIHPYLAGVAEPLMQVLLDAGADLQATSWNLVNACLANGRPWAAEFLAQRGAPLDAEGAAGVGRLDLLRSLIPTATPDQKKNGFAWACEFGKTSVVEYLLGQGMDVATRLRHNGQTGLHWAAFHAHADTVRLLLDHKAPVDARDETWENTPLFWALYAWSNPPAQALTPERYYDVVRVLVAAGATVEPEWRSYPKVLEDPKMSAALKEY